MKKECSDPYYIHSFIIGDWCKKGKLMYEGKTENIFENIFCIETVWAPMIIDMLHYLNKISCQVQLKHEF